MPAKKAPPKDERPQKERFIEAAKKAGVDETGEAFDRFIKKSVRVKAPRDRTKDG